ncbi:MAG: hypothetical protein LUE20_04940 [Oscillospiraceae bacterium]|nr:hypothetical protein [Oscillospiraceae bacterium]
MTLTQAIDQVYEASVGGWFNGMRFSKEGWRKHIKTLMRRPETLKIPNSLVQEIRLPDGCWLFTISYIPSCKTYGWNIPETRAEEQKLKDKLIG